MAIVNTFELERHDSGVAVWVWEYWHGNERLGAALDVSVSEARELAALLVEYANKSAPTEAAVEAAEYYVEMERESMYEYMTSPMEKK